MKYSEIYILCNTHKNACSVRIFFNLSENSKKGSSSGDKDGSEKSSSHHSSGSLPPVAMETTNKDAEDEGWCKVHVLCCFFFKFNLLLVNFLAFYSYSLFSNSFLHFEVRI